MRYCFVLVLLFVFATEPVHAARSDEDVVKFMEGVRTQLLSQAKLQDGSFVPPETAAEKAYPIIPVADGRRVMDRGDFSGILEWCKLEATPQYLAFMQEERNKKQWSDKQLAYIGLLHGAARTTAQRGLQQLKGDCSPKQKEHIKKRLDAMSAVRD